MDLKEKLKYYQTNTKSPEPETKINYDKIAEYLGGQILEADTLPIIIIEAFFPYTLFTFEKEIISSRAVHLKLLTKNQFTGEIPVNNIIIFDLETTGLAGGTGTYPFLIGLGRFEEEGIRIYQYLLPDYGREIGAYLDMRRILDEKTILLSFNGKSFDYPLLRNRMIMNRMENPFDKFAHLDLLHPARRLWRDILPSCSLDTIEEEIFLFSRYQDIDGALIPQAYFDFLRTGDISQIRKIVLHNQQDLMSLGRLLFHMHRIENYPPPDGHSTAELLAMLDICIDLSDLNRIYGIFDLLENSRRKIPDRSLLKYSLLLKRLKKWDEALSIWHGFIDRSSEILFATEELAKYYEHRENDPQQAIKYTNRAIQYIDLMQEITDQDQALAAARKNFLHRLWRLNAKLNSDI